jgi:hypothetical protein
MAKTNPCQVCGEVPDAAFTVSCFVEGAGWLEDIGQPVANICETCLLNWAYRRVVELASAGLEEGETPVLEAIERDEAADAAAVEAGNGHRPKSKRPQTQQDENEVPAAAPAAHD